MKQLVIIVLMYLKIKCKNTQIQKYCLNTLTYTSFTVYIIFNKINIFLYQYFFRICYIVEIN